MGTFVAWLNETFFAFDHGIIDWIHGLLRNGAFWAPCMTFIGHGLIMVAFALVLFLFAPTRKGAVCLVVSVLIGAVITNLLLKDWIARPRPFSENETYRLWWQMLGATEETDGAFPSGHGTAAAAGMIGLCFASTKKQNRVFIPVSVAYFLLAGVARIYLMVHYPTDLLAGAVVGLVAAVLGMLLVRLLWKLCNRWRGVKLFRWFLDLDVRQLFKKRQKPAAV